MKKIFTLLLLALTITVVAQETTKMDATVIRNSENLPVIDGIRYADTYMLEVVDKDKKTYKVKDGTKWIDDHAFWQCKQMEEVVFPESVEDIGVVEFYNCVNLRSITCLATIPPKAHKDKYKGTDDTFTGLLPALITVYVPTQSVEAYKKDSKWGKFNIVGIEAKGTK